MIDIKLAERALELILKHEWNGNDGTCPECGESGPIEGNVWHGHIMVGRQVVPGTHSADCEWAAIVAEARKNQNEENS